MTKNSILLCQSFGEWTERCFSQMSSDIDGQLKKERFADETMTTRSFPFLGNILVDYGLATYQTHSSSISYGKLYPFFQTDMASYHTTPRLH